MKIFKTLSLIVTLIVLVVVGGVSYLITTFDANHYKKQIIEQVKTETGRDLSLPGDVNLKFFPSIALSIGEARLGSSEGFGDKDFAIIKKAKIAVELMPLLNRKLKIKEVQLDGLELDLLTKADGSTSWGDLTASKSGNASASSKSAPKKNSSKVVEDLLGSLSIAGLSLRDATVHWHDIPKSQKISMTSLQLTTGVFKQGSPLDVSYSVQLLQHKPLLKLAAKGKTTVTLSQNNQYFSLENLILDFQASGDQIPNGQLNVVLEGDVAGSLKQVKASNLELQLSLNGDLVPEGALKAHLTTNADVDLLLSRINLSGLSLKTDLSGSYVDGGELEALLKGDAVIDLAKQLVTMPQLNLVTSLKGGYAKGGQSSAHLQANTRFDIAQNKLQLSAFKFTGDLAGKLLQGKGNIELEGETLAYILDKETLLINGLQLKGGVNGALLNGEANADLSSQALSLDLDKKMLKLTGLQLTGDIKGKVLAGGSANSSFASDSLSYQLEKQELNIIALTGEVSTQDGLLKKGKAHSTVTTDLQFNVEPQVLKLSKLQLALEVDGELLSGMRTQTQLKGDLQLDLAKYQVSSTHFDLQGKAAEGLLEQSKLSYQSKGHFDVSWKQETGSAALDILNVSIDDAEIKASQVKLSPLGGLPTLSGYFSTNVIQLRPLLQHFAIKLPAMNNPKALSTLRASFQLIADKKNIDLQKINIKLDDSTIQGHFSMQDFSNPRYKPELTIDKLKLDDYLAPKGESTQPVAASSMSTSATVQATDSSLFPIKALRALQLKGGIKIGSLYFNDLSFSHLVAKVNAHDGVIKLNPLQANLYKGVYKGHLTLNVQNSTPQITMHHVVDHLRSEGLLFDLFEDRYLSGQANLVTDLAARGDSVDALLASLSGKTQLSFKNGTIRDSKFAEKVSLAVNAFEKESIQDGQKVVKFTGLSGEWQVNKGVFSTENLSLLSPYFSIEGQGEANIGSQTLDMLMRIGPKNKGEGQRLYAPLRVKGPFSNLSFSLDMKDLLKTLAQQDIEEAKRKLKEKVEAEKLKLQQRLVEEKKAARLKVDAEKERAKQRLTVEKEKYQLKWKAEQAQLKEKSEQAQMKAKQALKQKLSDEAASQLKQKLGEDAAKKLKEKVESSVDTEKLKEVEDKIKDKLKDKFKGLF